MTTPITLTEKPFSVDFTAGYSFSGKSQNPTPMQGLVNYNLSALAGYTTMGVAINAEVNFTTDTIVPPNQAAFHVGGYGLVEHRNNPNVELRVMPGIRFFTPIGKGDIGFENKFQLQANFVESQLILGISGTAGVALDAIESSSYYTTYALLAGLSF